MPCRGSRVRIPSPALFFIVKGKVVVGLSGGVDSSVAALLLKEAGYEVVGVSVLLNPEGGNPNSCCSISALHLARRVAAKLDIPFHTLDYSEGFRREIITYFIDEYRRGRTPNPCLLCNRDYKLKALFDFADEIGADYVATGHYVRKTSISGVPLLRRGPDFRKDQSYFLFRIPREWIPRLLFPVGDMSKEEVRRMALERSLPTAKRPESQDLCFIKGDYRDFLKERGVEGRRGRFIYHGRVVGYHDGAHNFTVGQRRGLGVSVGRRVYVRAIVGDDVILGDLREVMARRITVKDLNWHLLPGREFEANVQIRASSRPGKGRVVVEGDTAQVLLYEPLFAPAPGQGAAFYIGDVLIGGGTIEEYSP